MNSIEKYKKYRKVGMKLNHRIMDKCLDRDTLRKSAKLLGIIQKGTFVFDNEDETSVLMDFALNDYRFINKNVVERYREKFGWKNEIEKDIFDALSASYTSLFNITSISRLENTLILSDLLNKKDDIKLIDIAFSNTITHSGYLLFTRLLPFKDFNMTSGVTFVFRPYKENHLIRLYKKKTKKIKSDDDAIKRFIAFYELNKTLGIDVAYI
ncbi:MAG: hypothetical protein MUO82_11575 [Candidatus Thermoplasmatota archaeon]|nr:hypothetical protein [Candidatus Thermoplasmatota archaeon]